MIMVGMKVNSRKLTAFAPSFSALWIASSNVISPSGASRISSASWWMNQSALIVAASSYLRRRIAGRLKCWGREIRST